MARPRSGEEKNARATIAARITPELRARVEKAADGAPLTDCFVEALEDWCAKTEAVAARKRKRT